MSDHTSDYMTEQPDLFEYASERSLLDQLLADSRMYTTSKGYSELLEFVVRLRNFAPFNAMLLQVQKPGLSYAASARDWRDRFERFPKEGARPLLILWPFGPVALVYDLVDTFGEDVPQDALSFLASGAMTETRMKAFMPLVLKKNIDWEWVDAGDQNAGSIRVTRRASNSDEATAYRIHINRNHAAPTQFTTLAHELAHLFLGHLGPDKKLNVPKRRVLDHASQELEAESVAYITCGRNGVTSKSESYLSAFVTGETSVESLDLYQIMRAAGQVEAVLGLGARTRGCN